MSVETHEWQREKDKKTYLKMLENNDDDIKDAYYDPKQFRGSNKAKSRSKISVFVVLSFLFGLLLIGFTIDYFLEGKIKKSIENFFQDNVLSINTLEQSSAISKNEGVKNDNLLSSQVGKCSSGYADMQDVKIYTDYTDDLIKILDAGKVALESNKLSQNEKIAAYNKLIIYTLGAVNFHNNKLTKCFSNIAKANEVNKRSKMIDDKLKELSLLLK